MFPGQVFGSTLLRMEVEMGSASSPASEAGGTVSQTSKSPFSTPKDFHLPLGTKSGDHGRISATILTI